MEEKKNAVEPEVAEVSQRQTKSRMSSMSRQQRCRDKLWGFLGYCLV
jgi:hypothetical protein